MTALLKFLEQLFIYNECVPRIKSSRFAELLEVCEQLPMFLSLALTKGLGFINLKVMFIVTLLFGKF